MAIVPHKFSNSLEGALAGGGDPATSPLYVFGPFLKLIVVAGVAKVTFGATVWLVVLTITLVSAMYRLVMRWIVDGSGGSGLSEEEFGTWAVRLDASIVFTEYTLTFLVSMAALVTFIADRFPVLNEPFLGLQARTYVAIALSVATGWLVNRGPKAAVRVFGPATAGVLFLLWAMVIATIWKLGFRLPQFDWQAFSPKFLNFTLGGYVRILAVMTGIEIFANLVAAYEGTPRQKSEKAFRSLLIIMGTTAVTMLVVGPAILRLSDPTNDQVSVFTQTMDQLLPGPLPYLGTIVGVTVLLSASAASAQGLQNLALGLTRRHYLPAVIGQRNRFEVADKPAWIEVGIVSICFLVFGTNEETYLALYAAGVFILLSLTGWAASKRLRRKAAGSPSWGTVATLGGTVLAALLTSTATVIIFVERFTDGAWIYFFCLPLLYVGFTLIRRRLGPPAPLAEQHKLLFGEPKSLPLSKRNPLCADLGFQNILVPLDGSSFSEQALPVAQALCQAAEARITLLTVKQTEKGRRLLPLFEDGQGPPGDFREQEDYLRHVASRLAFSQARIDLTVSQGEVAEQIAREISRRNADLLVMSAHGRSGMSRELLGSISSQLIQIGRVPLLLLRPVDELPETSPVFGKLMVTLDGSNLAEKTLPYAGALATCFESEVLLLAVPDALESRSQQARIKDYVEDVASAFRELNLPVRTLVAGSDPAQTIISVARSEAIDLIFMATHGLGGLDRLMIGSVADTVIKVSRRPIFLVPARSSGPQT